MNRPGIPVAYSVCGNNKDPVTTDDASVNTDIAARPLNNFSIAIRVPPLLGDADSDRLEMKKAINELWHVAWYIYDNYDGMIFITDQ